MKYKLVWCDSFNTFNWDDEGTDEEGIERDFDDVVNNGIKNLKKEYPTLEIDSQDIDGWIDCTITKEFEALNFKEVRNIVDDILSNTGRVIDVFSVVDETGKTIFTEEDFYG